MQTIQLLEDMKSCVTQGEKTIPAGTVMREFYSQLSWTYFKDEVGNTLIIMGFSSPDWNKVKKFNRPTCVYTLLSLKNVKGIVKVYDAVKNKCIPLSKVKATETDLFVWENSFNNGSVIFSKVN